MSSQFRSVAHHRAVHRAGDERAWWKNSGIDPVKVARKLWKDTRANKGQTLRAGSQHLNNALPAGHAGHGYR